jgi:glycerol-3-phosphate cytidylyltransferase
MLENSLLNQIEQLHQQGKVITLVTGVFDLFHQEHLHFLQKAKELGDILIVGIESDVRVRKMKGEGRPIQNQETRLATIQNLPFVDIAFILPEDFSKPADHDQLIKEIHPAYLAVSSHTAHQKEKQAILAKYGGEVKVVLDQNPAVSTTLLKQDLVRNS